MVGASWVGVRCFVAVTPGDMCTLRLTSDLYAAQMHIRPARARQGGNRLRLRAVLAVLGLLFPPLAGCEDDTAGLHVDQITTYSIAPLQEAMRLHVVRGRIRPGPWGTRASASLDAYLRLLADNGPATDRRLFPRDLQRAGYYLNAHTAAVLDTWRQKAEAKGGGGHNPRLTEADRERRVHQVDGKAESIASLAALAMEQGVPLTELALGDGTIGAPPLPRPFQRPDPAPALRAHATRVLSAPDAFQEVELEMDADSDADAPAAYATFPAILAAVPDRMDVYTFLDRELPVGDARRLAVLRAARAGRVVPMPRSDAPAYAD